MDAPALLTACFPDPLTVERDVAREGFAIYEGAIDPAALEEMKAFWRAYFSDQSPKQRVIRGNMRLGEENLYGFSDNPENCLYRDIDFLWNRPTHAPTRELGEQIHRIRNQAQHLDADAGFAYRADCYGIYISTSCYPVDSGWMRVHSDGHQEQPILQYMAPITHKGVDYDDGGLFLHRADGTKVDVDARMPPGSVVFFDGRLRHGVDTIRSRQSVGRIASFAITTFFKTRAGLPDFLRRAEDAYFSAGERFARLRGRVVKPAY